MISIWEKDAFFAPQDVVIIGSGFTGLWTAYHLKKKFPQRKVTVIDRGIIPTGASTRNAGFACFGSLSEVVADGKRMGTDNMLNLVEMRYKGLKRIRKTFPSAQIDFDLCGGYELYEASDAVSSEKLMEEISYTNMLLRPVTGTKNTYRLSDDKIEPFGFGNTKHLVMNKLEGALHSGKLIRALLLCVQAMDVQVLFGVEAMSYEKRNGSIQVTTNQSFHFKTNQLIICTNAFAKDLVPEADVVPARGQVVLTSPIEGLPFKGTFHADEGYYYFRNIENRVLLGGARNKAFSEEQTFATETTETIQNELERYLDEIILPRFRNQYTIDFRWSGIMAMGEEKLPVIKEVEPEVFCAVRMSGMGVALAPVAGQLIAKMVQ